MIILNVKNIVKNQSMIFNMLKQAKIQDRLSHAYLFYGQEGTGKKEMAYALACMLYCEHDGCLECDTCKSILSGNHMNVDYIGIEANKTMISKDQITSLQDEFSKTSLVEGVRIYIVDGIDTASSAAQNSLLKFIEDPMNMTPTIGVFLARDLSGVVSTIQSRCVMQHFGSIPIDKMVATLIDSNIDKLDAILAAHLTNNIDEAISIATEEKFEYIKNLFIELLDLTKPKHAIEYYLSYLSFFSDSKNISILLQWLLLFLEDCNIHKDQDSLILTPLYDKIMMYRKKNEKYLRYRLTLVLELLDKLKYNISAKNVFHELMVKIV